MAEPVKRKGKVTNASYIEEADSILLMCEDKDGVFRHQIHSSTFNFNDNEETNMVIKKENRKIQMYKTARLFVGKNLTIVYDPDLEAKMKENYPLHY